MNQTTAIAAIEARSIPVPESGCWLWLNSVDRDGYGVIVVKGIHGKKAHRIAYQAANGEIPAGACVCHRCDTPRCVNPDHLFLGSQADNVRDCAGKGRIRNQNSQRTHCKNGHELTGENVKIEVTGFRRCITCRRQYLSQYDKGRRQ